MYYQRWIDNKQRYFKYSFLLAFSECPFCCNPFLLIQFLSLFKFACFQNLKARISDGNPIFSLVSFYISDRQLRYNLWYSLFTHFIFFGIIQFWTHCLSLCTFIRIIQFIPTKSRILFFHISSKTSSRIFNSASIKNKTVTILSASFGISGISRHVICLRWQCAYRFSSYVGTLFSSAFEITTHLWPMFTIFTGN